MRVPMMSRGCISIELGDCGWGFCFFLGSVSLFLIIKFALKQYDVFMRPTFYR